MACTLPPLSSYLDGIYSSPMKYRGILEDEHRMWERQIGGSDSDRSEVVSRCLRPNQAQMSANFFFYEPLPPHPSTVHTYMHRAYKLFHSVFISSISLCGFRFSEPSKEQLCLAWRSYLTLMMRSDGD